jgi:signal transduction histidine kinase
MLRIISICLLLSVRLVAVSQPQLQLSMGRLEQHELDSLHSALRSSPVDSVRFQLCNTLGSFYIDKNKDSSIYYTEQATEISRKNLKYLAEASSLMKLQNLYKSKGDLSMSYRSLARAMEIAEDPASERTHYDPPPDGDYRKQRLQILTILHGGGYGDLYLHTRNISESIDHYKQGIRILNEIEYFRVLPQFYIHMSWAYRARNAPDSALYYALLAEQVARERNNMYHIEVVYHGKGDAYFDKGMMGEALDSYRAALASAIYETSKGGIRGASMGLSRCYYSLGQKDSSLYYARKARESLVQRDLPESSNFGVYERLYQAFLINHEKDSAFKYLDLAKKAKDSYNKEYVDNLASFQTLFLQDRIKLNELEKDRIQVQSRVRTTVLLSGIGLLLLLSAITYRNAIRKQKANVAITKAYTELQDAQNQLVQREKMASLGEMTAGIAHEIQNPLNFVNNFSEVSVELMDEMVTELNKESVSTAKEISVVIKNNLEKIRHHGTRAAAIVKGMLQHSRSGSGHRELTDINALADEYLKLGYHGIRAQDAAFIAAFETDLTPSMPMLSVAPQEIGRVILNLVNNAFYAVGEKHKQSGEEYEPKVTVSTRQLKDAVEISVKDNGNGLSDAIKQKIFQPFFTTKPSGKGTGLGLSICYDIVNAHGGEITVTATPGAGTEFVVKLPL